MFEVEEYASTAGVFPILVKRLSLVEIGLEGLTNGLLIISN